MLKINRSKILKTNHKISITLPSPPKKVNIKIHKSDLKFIEGIAKELATSRSLILNEIIKKVLTRKIKEEVHELDSQIFLASIADEISPQQIVDGCNDLHESWVFEVVREEIKEMLLYKYNNHEISEHDPNFRALSKSEVDLIRHSEEHNDCVSLVRNKIWKVK